MATGCKAWSLARMTSSSQRTINETDERGEMFVNICATSHIWAVSQEEIN